MAFGDPIQVVVPKASTPTTKKTATTAKKTTKPKAQPITGSATGVKNLKAPPISKTQIAAPPSTGKPNYADANYWDELNALLKNADNYKANMALQKSRVGEDYETQLRRMQLQRSRDLPAIEDDFAARGIVRSGLYGKRVGEYEQDYNNSRADVTRSKDRQLQDISAAYNQYLDQWRMQKQAAQKAAIQRKLAKQKK